MRTYLGQKLAKVAGNIYTVAPRVLERCIVVLAGFEMNRGAFASR
ncbi:UNVERIFIED_ORG: hypothetical protein J2Y81_002999 [Paraburkholderia sediminicola]|nr:hypothetical protein [Paraburkholderia sediminicola]